MLIKRVSAYAAVYLLWGGSYLAVRLVVQVIPPMLAASIRYILSGLILLLLSLVIKGSTLPSRRQILNSVLSGIAMFAFGYAVVFWAEIHLTSWLVAVLISTTSLWTYLGECLVLRTNCLRARVLIPLIMGMAGMPFLVGATFHRGQMLSAIAAGAVLVAAFVWSAGTLTLKAIELPSSPLQTAGLQLSSSGLLLLAISRALHEGAHLPSIGQMFSYQPLLGMTYLVLGGSVVGFTAFHWLLSHEPASLVSTAAYVNPIVAMMLGIGLVHERCSPMQIVGAATILASVILVWRAQRIPTESKSRKDIANATSFRPYLGEDDTLPDTIYSPGSTYSQ
jgi:drug/metabolite transporter (DMT)-like permease